MTIVLFFLATIIVLAFFAGALVGALYQRDVMLGRLTTRVYRHPARIVDIDRGAHW